MVRTTYAIWWREGDGPRRAGKLTLGPFSAVLSGNGKGSLAVPFGEIVSAEYSQGELILTRRDGSVVRIGNLDGAGALLELADALGHAA